MTSLRSGVKLTLMKTISNSISRTLDFKGRSSIKELFFYLLFLVIQLLIFFVFNQIKVGTILPIIEAMYGWTNILHYIEVVLGGILLLSFIPLICLVIRRLHDINLSGFFIGIPIVIEIGLRVADEVLMIFEYTDNFIGIVGILIFIGLVFLCTPFSHKKNNKYGKYIP